MSDALAGSPGFLALVAQLAAFAVVLAGARAAVARLVPGLDGAARAVAVAVAAAGFVVLTMQLLGFTGMLRPGASLGLLLLPAVLAWRWRAFTRRSTARPDTSADRLEPAALLLAVATISALALPLLRSLLSVPLDWDGLSYHLFFPARYLQEGRIFPLELGRPIDQAALYPQNGELVHAFAMLFLRNDLLVAPVMALFTLLTGVAVYALVGELGGSRSAAWSAAAVAATLPPLYSRSASSYVEPLLDFAQVAALLFALKSLASRTRPGRFAVVAGLGAGLAAGTKYTALATAAVLLLFLALPADGRRARLLGFGGACAATSGAWYLRNLWLTGNPLFPAPFFGLPYLERSDLPWHGSNVWTHGWALLRSGELGDDLFALPPAIKPSFSLGLALLLLLPLAALGLLEELRGARALGARRELNAALRRALPVAVLGAAVATYLAVPFWLKSGFLRSLVRFAVPWALVAVVLAFVWLSRRRVGSRFLALGGGAALAYQLAVSLPKFQLYGRWSALGRLALALAVAAAAVAALRALPALRPWTPLFATLLVAVALFPTAVAREERRARDWSQPSPYAGTAAAALALESLAPGRGTIAFAADDYSEFLYLFVGRQLERRVVGVPVTAGPEEVYRRKESEHRRAPSLELWLDGLRAEQADLLAVSRWGSRSRHWPIEQTWAERLRLPLLFENPDIRVYRVSRGQKETFDGNAATSTTLFADSRPAR